MIHIILTKQIFHFAIKHMLQMFKQVFMFVLYVCGTFDHASYKVACLPVWVDEEYQLSSSIYFCWSQSACLQVSALNHIGLAGLTPRTPPVRKTPCSPLQNTYTSFICLHQTQLLHNKLLYLLFLSSTDPAIT